MAYLDSKTKFSMTNPVAVKPLDSSIFFKWSNDNMYRTSTADMSKKVTFQFSNTLLKLGSSAKAITRNPWLCRLQTSHCS